MIALNNPNVTSVFYNTLWIQIITFIIVITITTFSSGIVFAANQAAANEDGKSFADALNAGIADSAKNPVLTDIPQYQGEDVPEKQYYNSGVGIEDEALLHSITDSTSTYISGARNTRPQFNINEETDPLFKREEEIVNLSRTLSDTYSGCIALPVGNEDITVIDQKECLVQGRKDIVNYNCQKILNVTCSNPNVGEPYPYSIGNFTITGDNSPYSQSGDTFTFGSWNNNHSGNCSWYYRTIQFYVEDASLITEFSFDQIRYDDWLDISINGWLSFRGIGAQQGTHLSGTFSCEHGRIFSGSNFNALHRIRTGWNTIYAANLVHGGGNYHFRFTLKRIRGCDEVSETTYECPDGENHIVGDLESNTCVSSGWREISGVNVYRSCWQWSQNFTRLTDPIYTRDPECDIIEQQGCGQVSSTCIVDAIGYCGTEQLTFDCPHLEAATHVDLCGDVLSCSGGDCASEYQTSKDATQDFQQAAASLAVAGELAEEFDYENLSVFEGDGKKCEKKTAGFSDCCKDSGWGTDIGLSTCDTEEEELGIKREQGAAHYVGDYCSKDSDLLGCLAKKYTYCTYPSKLSRIIVEQGNSQMGRGYGSAEDPSCPGFTLDELEALDFNSMDFSEFYSDVMQKANAGTVGDPDQLVQDLADKINQLGGGHQ
jgi:conjugal transfer mating pair stabilization protein TraN